MELKFPSQEDSPTNKCPPWRRFLAANGGVVLTWIVVIICVLAAMRMRSGDDDAGSKEKIFSGRLDEPIPRNRSADRRTVAPSSSLDAAPLWGGLPRPIDEDGPVEEEPAEEPPAQPQAQTAEPPAAAGMGFAMPQIDASKMAENLTQEQLKKPDSVGGQGGGGSAAAWSAPAVASQDKEKDEAEKARNARAGATLGPALNPSKSLNKPSARRDKLAVIRSGKESAVPQALPVEKAVLYQIQELINKAAERSSESGTPGTITAAEAEALIRGIGVRMGPEDKRPAPSNPPIGSTSPVARATIKDFFKPYLCAARAKATTKPSGIF